VQVNDYVPDGLILNDADWSQTADIATLNTPIPTIEAGDDVTVNVTFTVDPDFSGTGIVNNAEIFEAYLLSGALAQDIDSQGGDDGNNDPDEDDDDTSDINGGDDFDPASIVIIPNADIGDTVWVDNNANGIFDDGEAGIAGVIVNVLDENGDIAGTTTTDVNGFYTVEDLEPGDYQVQFVLDNLVGDWVISPLNVGSDLTDSDADPSTGLTEVTTLDPAEYDTTFDLGIYQTASLGDEVWYDANEDGIYDDNELPVEGATVTLYDGNGNEVTTTVTNADGEYLFDDLTPGLYYIGYTTTDGQVITVVNAGGNDDVDSEIDPATGISMTTELTSGETDLTWDIGIYIDEEIEISDPCVCYDEREYGSDDVYKFRDQITITATPGTNWTVQSQTGMFEIDPINDIQLAVGTVFTEVMPGIFTLEFLHDDRVGYTVVATDGNNTAETDAVCEAYDLVIDPIETEICFFEDPVTLSGRATLGNIQLDGTLVFSIGCKW